MQAYYDHWFDVTKSVLGVPGMIGSLALQPMPKAITSKAKAKGGVSPTLPTLSFLHFHDQTNQTMGEKQDLMNFPTDTNYIIFELDFSYHFAASDSKIDEANRNLFRGLDRICEDFTKKGMLPDVKRPMFLNDANYAQDYWSRLDTTAHAREVRERYDPEMFFQKRTSGGFRLG